MLKSDRESSVDCTCGRPAVQREVTIDEAGARQVVYQTHHLDMFSAEHHAVYGRIVAFHKKLHALEAEMNALPVEERKLPVGRFLVFEFENAKPSACDVRTEFIPTAQVQAFGGRAIVRLSRRSLEEASAASILAELRSAATPVVEALRNGDY